MGRFNMTLKQLLKMTTPDAVLKELLLAYPECDSEKHLYKEVLDFLIQTPEYPIDEFVISIALVDPSDDETYEQDIDEEAYLSISGYSEKENLHFALSFAKWEEWANAKINVQEDLDVNVDELIAICLYEMTFYGFDQTEIAEAFENIESGLMLH